jgi:hypothetical protein
MKQRIVLSMAVLGALAAATAAEARGWRHHSNVSMSGEGREGITRCSQWHVEFGDRDATVTEEHLTIPISEASPLVASSPENGGITVIGGEGRDFEVNVCKAAEEDDARTLEAIHVVRQKGRLSVDGPSDADWTAQIIIHAPKNASVDLETHNGPVSLRRSSGNIEVRTTNGPIHFEGGSGKVRLEAQNGPLSVHLQDSTWTGGELEARTQNGPVHLDLAGNYSSGVVVATSGRSPVHCGAEACRNARRNWDDDGKTIEWGAGNPVVRLSTENGPVSIGSRD